MTPRLTASEKQRFENEVVPHLDVLYRMARSVCCDRDVADEVAQEAFLKALGGFHGLRPGTNSRAWLARIVHNACRDNWRQRTRRGEHGWDDDLEAEVDALGAAPDWQPGVIREAFDDDVETALQALPPRWRAAILLVDVEGWSYDEAAEGLGIASGSLRSALHRARRVLYARLVETAAGRGRRMGEAAT